jgi:Skp family chaperone for outer membrane proteins
MDDRTQQGVLNVKAVANLLPLFVALTCLLVPRAWAQTKPPAGGAARPRPAAPVAPGGAVAVVDISYIFKNHAGFKAEMDKMKVEVQQYEEQLRARHQALATERERLTQFRPGTPDYEKLERSLADSAAQLQIDTQLKKKEFIQRESKVYYVVYQQVLEAIRDFAEQKGIDLVLRYNGDQIDPDDRASVLQGVNRDLVYHRNLDITREILDRVNRTMARRPAPSQGTRQ